MLNVLEIEDDPVTLHEHLMDEVSLLTYDKLLEALRELILKIILAELQAFISLKIVVKIGCVYLVEYLILL